MEYSRIGRLNSIVDGPLTNLSLDSDFASFDAGYPLSSIATEIISAIKEKDQLTLSTLPEVLQKVSAFDGLASQKGRINKFVDFTNLILQRIDLPKETDLLGKAERFVDDLFSTAVSKKLRVKITDNTWLQLYENFADLIIHEDLKTFNEAIHYLRDHKGGLDVLSLRLDLGVSKGKNSNKSKKYKQILDISDKVYQLYDGVYEGDFWSYNPSQEHLQKMKDENLKSEQRWEELIVENQRLRKVLSRSLDEPDGSIYWANQDGVALSNRENLVLLKHLLCAGNVDDDTCYSDTLYGPQTRYFHCNGFVFSMDYMHKYNDTSSETVKAKGSPEGIGISISGKDLPMVTASLPGVTQISKTLLFYKVPAIRFEYKRGEIESFLAIDPKEARLSLGVK